MEYAVLFCQIFALASYILICKLLTIAKSYLAKPEELAGLIRTGDPFWTMLLVGSKMDFMRQENVFMQTITLVILNIMISTIGSITIYG